MRAEIGLHLSVNHIRSFKPPVWLNRWPANCLSLDSVSHANMDDNPNKGKYILMVHDSLRSLTNSIIYFLKADAASELFWNEAPPSASTCNSSYLTWNLSNKQELCVLYTKEHVCGLLSLSLNKDRITVLMWKSEHTHTHIDTHTHTRDFHSQIFLLELETWDHLSSYPTLDSERCSYLTHSSLLEQMRFWGSVDSSVFACWMLHHIYQKNALYLSCFQKPDHQVVGVVCGDLHVFLLFLWLSFSLFGRSPCILQFPGVSLWALLYEVILPQWDSN